MNPMRAQGCYYLTGDLWMLANYRSFESVTGPKPDRFVTHAAGALYTIIGSALLLRRDAEDSTNARRTALLTALATLAVDLRHRSSVRWGACRQTMRVRGSIQ